MEETSQYVHCPNCANGRLFDLCGEGRGTVKIKCPVCKTVVEVHLEDCDEKRQKRLLAYYRSMNTKPAAENTQRNHQHNQQQHRD